MSAASMSVSALARRAGVAPDTVRYYEKAGLLPPPERSATQYRRYDESAVDRLQFIRGSQRLGLRLREIKTLLEVRDTGECPCWPAEQLLRARISEVDREVARLTTLRHDLVEMVDALAGPECPQPVPGSWRPPTDDHGEEAKPDDRTYPDLPVLRRSVV